MHVVEVVTNRDHRDAPSGVDLREMQMPSGLGQHGDVTWLTHRCWLASRIMQSNVAMPEQAFDATANDAVTYQPDGHVASPSAMLIGRQPPCCGGMPPRPFTLIAAAAAPVITNAAMILRSTFT